MFTTIGPRAGILPDRRAVLLRAPRPDQHRPHAVRRQAAQGAGARRPLLRLHPRAHPGLMLETELRAVRSWACRSRRATTRSRRASTRSRRSSRTPTSAADHQMLMMQIAAEHGAAATAWSACCTRSPSPGVNGSGKHNNWSMGTDTGREPARPGRHAARERAVPGLLRGGDPGGQQAPGAAARVDRRAPATTTAWAPTRRRRRSSRSSSAASCESVFEEIESGKAQTSKPGSFLGLGTPVLPPLPLHGGDRNRTSPFAFTGNKFEFRALGLEPVAGAAEHGAEHDRRGGDRRARRQARGRP